MTIRRLNETIEVTDVVDIAVTSITTDVTAGDYWRDLVFFGAPGVGSEVRPEVLRVRIRGPSQAALKVSVPESEF